MTLAPFLHLFSDSQISGRAVRTFLPLRWDVSDVRRPRAASSSPCFSNEAFDLSSKGSLIYCRKLDVEWAPGAAAAAGWASSGASLPRSTKLCYDQLTIIPSSNRGFILSFVWITGAGFFLFVKWEYV